MKETSDNTVSSRTYNVLDDINFKYPDIPSLKSASSFCFFLEPNFVKAEDETKKPINTRPNCTFEENVKNPSRVAAILPSFESDFFLYPDRAIKTAISNAMLGQRMVVISTDMRK